LVSALSIAASDARGNAKVGQRYVIAIMASNKARLFFKAPLSGKSFTDKSLLFPQGAGTRERGAQCAHRDGG
jgi:hypothetical protein